MRLGLSSKIIFVIFSSSIIMLGLMLYFGFKFSRETIESQTSKLMQDKFTDVARQIDTLIAGYITQMNVISTDPSIQLVLSSDKNKSENLKVINSRLSNLLIYSGPWDDLLLLDRDGKTIAVSSVHTGGKLIDIYLEEKALIGRAKQEHNAYTDIFDVKGEKEFSCISSVRVIIEGKETIVGFVVGRIALRSIEDIMSNSSDNIILYKDDGTQILKNINQEKEKLIKSSDLVNFTGFSFSYISNQDSTLNMITMIREKGVPGYKGNDWILASVTDVTSYVADGEKGINKIIYIATFLLVLISVLIIIFLRKIVTNPVNKLQSIALSISQGNFVQNIEIKSTDEIGDLAKAFRDMSKQLSGLYGSLEERVKDKTKELEVKIFELEESKKITEKAIKDIEQAEEKLLEKNKQVEGAFNEVQHFARMADRERLTYSLLISSIGEAVVVVKPDGVITVVNPVFAQILNSKTDELEGASILDIMELHMSNGKVVDMPELRNILSEDRLHSFRYWKLNRKKDGVNTIISGVIAPLIDNKEGGIVRGMIFTFRDVVGEKLLEEARIGFISTASHQLRTPLTSMKWFAEMLRDGDAGEINDEQKHFVERIAEGIDRMVGMVNVLLQMARVEAGRTVIEPISIDLKEMIDKVVKTLEVDLREHTQNIIVKSNPENFPTIMLDKDYIWQIIQNLLTNAQRYSFDGTNIEIDLTIENEHAVVSVKDHGIGIPENSKQRLFEKFYRAENALAKIPSGTGLGLALVKMLVDEMGGVLYFESTEGEGTTFFLKIPLSGMRARSGEVKLSV